jgi:hypothetical protein
MALVDVYTFLLFWETTQTRDGSLEASSSFSVPIATILSTGEAKEYR